jgi:hypothetical protein
MGLRLRLATVSELVSPQCSVVIHSVTVGGAAMCFALLFVDLPTVLANSSLLASAACVRSVAADRSSDGDKRQ